MKLIDLDALFIGKANPAMFENRAYADGWNSLYTALQQATVVDAEPVRHGRWEYVNTSQGMMCSCSECGEIPECFEPDYCPNCGAKMDGGAEDGQ